MIPLSLHSEAFSRTGNIAAEGFRKLLGRPALGLVQTVIREAMQNSLDAAADGTGPSVLLRVRQLSEVQTDVLRVNVLTALPAEGATAIALEEARSATDLRVFEICDFGTSGLSGPTGADAPADGPELLNFVNFMRNVGAGRDTQMGGGTYGYGKTSLYALSRCATIVVDSMTYCRGAPVRRLMACHLGSAFDADTAEGRRRFTGRHWWGIPDGRGGIDPLEGEAAADLAVSLGLPERDPENTGTTIMILDPQLDSDDALAAELIETVLWNFWPRMCGATDANRRLSLEIEIDGDAISVPSPEEYPPLDLFAAALNACRLDDDVMDIRSLRPAKHLGKLALRKGLRADRHPMALHEESLLPQQASHIALMRPFGLVVRYLAGEPYSDPRFEWAGVFVCSEEKEVEQAFADAEPPAHDDWSPEMLPTGHTKRYVNVALTRLDEIARTHANPLTKRGDTESRGPSLAATATIMGRMLGGASSQGPGRKRGSGGGNASKRLALSSPRFVRLELDDAGQRLAVFEADLVNDRSLPSLTVLAEPHLVMDGASADASDIPVAFSGRVAHLAIGDVLGDGEMLPVGTMSGTIICHVPMPTDAAVGLRLTLVAGEIDE